MAASDQLEIINSQGEIRFHDLSGPGITNIGRHPDNDIVIPSPVVAPFHAILDHQQKPYRIVALNSQGVIKVSGQLLEANKPRDLHNWDTIELDGHSLILMEGGPAMGAPAPAITPAPLPTPAPILGAGGPAAGGLVSASDIPDLDELDRLLSALPEDHSDDVILVECAAQTGAIDPNHPQSLDFDVEVEQPATMQVNVTNGGDLVGEFICEVRGLDPAWVSIAPAAINLNDGGRGSFSIALTAPRLPSSRAKAYYFSVIVTSPNYPGRSNSIGGLFIIKPYFAYAVGDVDPKKQNISWSKRVGKAVVPIINQGNSEAAFTVSGEDDQHAANIEFDSPEAGLKLVGQVQTKVAPEQALHLPISITPRKRRLVAFGGQELPYTITVAPTAGEQMTPRTVLAQARSHPLIGPLPLILLVVLLLLLLVWFFTPRIYDFSTDTKAIKSGGTATLTWSTSPFTTLHIDPGVGKVDGSQGTKSVSPAKSITYTLTAESFLSPLYPAWFTAHKDAFVAVNPVVPVIEAFTAGSPSVSVGGEVTVSWQVSNASRLVLNINGAPETIPPEQYTGNHTYTLDSDTTFNLQAFNADAPDGVSQSLVVKTTVPTATPYPAPSIKQFDVGPQAITLGDQVTLAWNVVGVNKVKITGVENDLPATGTLTVRPTQNTSFVLTAETPDGQKVTSAQYQVIVNPPPTATPVPQAPKIEYFLAAPVEVAIGSPESKNIQMSWSVTGDVTSIEMTGPGFGKFTGLPKQGELKIATDKPTLFVLTAFNGTLTASQTAQIKVKNPVPKINSIAPASSSNIGGGSFVLVINGSGFVKDSKVQWAGTNRSTLYVSDTQLTATILPDDVTVAGTFEVKVFNPTPGGGSSGTVTFTLSNPTPSITGVSPAAITKGAVTDLTLTVSGTNFISGSTVLFAGAALPTSYVSSTELTAIISKDKLNPSSTSAVLIPISVTNSSPGGGASGAVTFTINPTFPVPTINDLSPTLPATPPGLSPASDVVGRGDLTITVNGTNFVSRSLVFWNSTPLTTTFVSDKQLTAIVLSSKFTSVGTAKVSVSNPSPCATGGACNSNPVNFKINGLTIQFRPVTTTPISIQSTSSQDLVVELLSSGSLYSPSTPLTIGLATSNPLLLSLHRKSTPTTCDTAAVTSLSLQGASSVTFCVRADIPVIGPTTGPGSVFASLPASVGAASAVQAVTVFRDPPSMYQMFADTASTCPTSAPSSPPTPSVPVGYTTGGSAFNILICGAAFATDSTLSVRFNSTPVNVVAASSTATQIVATIPTSLANAAGTVQVQVFSGTLASTPAGGMPFDIALPTTTSASSSSTVYAGDQGFTLTVNGSNFVSNVSRVFWNGAQRTTTCSSSTVCTAAIPSADVVADGTATITVRNNPVDSATTSNSQTFTIQPATFQLLSPSGTSTLTVGSSLHVTANASSPAVQSVIRTFSLTANSNLSFVAYTSGACQATSITTLQLPASTASVDFCIVGLVAGSTSLAATVPGLPNAAVQSLSITVGTTGTSLTVTDSDTTGHPITGEPYQLSATVTSATGVTPTGTVTFSDVTGTATVVCNTVALSNGTATCNANAPSAGSRTIQATYNPSANFSTSTNTVAVTVTAANTSTTLSTNASTFTYTYGQAMSFNVTAIVQNTSRTGPSPTGTVTFQAQSGATTVTLCSGLTVNSSGSNRATVTCAVSLSGAGSLNVGTYTMSASYSPSPADFAASSGNLASTFTVNQATPTISISSISPEPSLINQSYTVTVALTSTINPNSVTISVDDGSGATCSITTDGSGSNSCNLASTTSGAKTVTASFAGTTNYAAVSNTASHNVNPTLTLSAPSATTILVGGGADAASKASFTVTLNTGGTSVVAQTINLSASTTTVLKFTNCSTTTQITSIATSAGTSPSATFCAVGVGNGTSTVTATHNVTGGDSKTSTTVTVNNPTISLTPVNPTSAASVTLTVTITAAQTSAVTVSLSSSTSNGTVPGSVTIAANSTTATFVVTRVSAGSTVITASLPAAFRPPNPNQATDTVTFN
jgi:hypothetical protein